MSFESGTRKGSLGLRRFAGIFFFALGLSVFLVRLQHAGPYAFPEGGNLRAALLCLVLGAWFSRPRMERTGLARIASVLAIVVSPFALFFAAYATLAELEEVVVVYTQDARGEPAALRLWIMDDRGAEWANVSKGKADAYRLAGRRVELLRAGERACRRVTLVEDRSVVGRVHRLGSEKYAVKRLATAVGVFGEEVSPGNVALRFDGCEGRSKG